MQTTTAAAKEMAMRRERIRRRAGSRKSAVQRISTAALAKCGLGEVAYIHVMSPEEAKEMFPQTEDIPKEGKIFAMFAADGTPLALTDSRQSCLGHAICDELEVASVH